MLTLGLITPGDLAILMAGTGTTIADQPGQVVGMGTVTRPRLAAEPFCG
jgi:hypothetical protein